MVAEEFGMLRMLRGGKGGTQRAEPGILRLGQWGCEKGVETREIFTLGRVYDSEKVQCETGWGLTQKVRPMFWRD